MVTECIEIWLNLKWKHGSVECFLRFCFVCENIGRHMILQIFDIFTHELSLFSTHLTWQRHKNSTELKKDSIHWWKCQKTPKSRCRPTFRLRKQNRRKHSTVHKLHFLDIKVFLQDKNSYKLLWTFVKNLCHLSKKSDHSVLKRKPNYLTFLLTLSEILPLSFLRLAFIKSL